MSPFGTLGLPDEADEASIKRAYARLLRTHRPEDDALAFQRLHEAYVDCLEQARWRDADVGTQSVPDEPGEADRAADADPGPGGGGIVRDAGDAAEAAHDAAGPPFALEAFLEEFVQTARMPEVDIATWLRRHPDMFSFDNKAMVADTLVWHLLDEPPLPSRALAATLHHFELDVVNIRYQRMEGAIEQLRREAVIADGDPGQYFMADRGITGQKVREQRSWWWLIWLVFVLAHGARMLVDR